MNWYRKSQLDWNRINNDFDYHVQMILEGKKPAGEFSKNEFNDIYPHVLKTVDYVKTRPDLRVVHYLHKDGLEGYIMGQPGDVQSIVEGMRRIYEGRDVVNGHRMFGEGIGHSKEEIDKFVNKPHFINYPDKPEPIIPIIEFDEV